MKYSENESATLEFKRNLPVNNGNQIIKTIVGFCNQFGGKLIFGVDDNRDICGIDESLVKEGALKKVGKGPSVRYKKI